MWECDTCQISLPTADRESHLLGAEHWELEEAVEAHQRQQWDEIQAENEVQLCMEMEEREMWEMAEMEKEIGRIDEMCRASSVTGEEERTVEADGGVLLDLSDASEVHAEESTGETGTVTEEERREFEVGLVLNESEQWEIDEIARQVREIDEMCRENQGMGGQAGAGIGTQETELDRGLQAAEQRIGLPAEGEEQIQLADTNSYSNQDVLVPAIGSSGLALDTRSTPAEVDDILPPPYSPESSAQGARRDSLGNNVEHLSESIQPPLTTQWYVHIPPPQLTNSQPAGFSHPSHHSPTSLPSYTASTTTPPSANTPGAASPQARGCRRSRPTPSNSAYRTTPRGAAGSRRRMCL